MKKNTHLGCANYIPVDAFKGLCCLDKSPKFADDHACDKFELMPKCRHCRNYTLEDEFLGMCKNTHRTYPDLTVRTCEGFGWKN